MKREIKFRAWIPELGIMLNDITLYGNGQMGYDEDEFKAALPKDYVLDYDSSSVIKNYINDEGYEDFDKVIPVLLGEDWIWLEDSEFEPMQFTGLKDKSGKEIYEGDIIKMGDNPECWFAPRVVEFKNGAWMGGSCRIYTNQDKHDYQGDSNQDNWEIICNIFENPELLEAVA